MYINDVIKRCDRLCPNEYTTKEKYMWCDDLSAMLCQEHNKKYKRVLLKRGMNGTYLLPEGVTYEMIDTIIDGRREIKKYDFRSYGIRYLYGIRGQIIMPRCGSGKRDIKVVYLKKHTPIRDTRICGNLTFTRGGFYFPPSNERLEAGDSVNIKTDSGEEFKEVVIFSTELTENMMIFASVPEGTFDSLFSDGETEKNIDCKIKRIITDETECDAPYDLMYVDYVNAQICYYQRNYTSYNQHMNVFNQRLNAYQAWLQQRRTQDKDGKIINWF